jgi:hypothetical protein
MKQPSNEVSNKPSKKPYQPPQLLVFGDLSEMTLANQRIGRNDGGKKPGHRMTG